MASTTERRMIDYFKHPKKDKKTDEKLYILENEINAAFEKDYNICLMVDADIVNVGFFSSSSNKVYSLSDYGEYHWIVYCGNLKFLDIHKVETNNYSKIDTIQFDIFTWGDIKTIFLTKEQFEGNFYGYIRMK